jgi:hypothetical protein
VRAVDFLPRENFVGLWLRQTSGRCSFRH